MFLQVPADGGNTDVGGRSVPRKGVVTKSIMLKINVNRRE